jgi:hypothetical protein
MKCHSFAALGLMLTIACGGPEWELGDVPELSESIEGWPLGPGYTVRAQLSGGRPEDPPLAEAPLAADGTFHMTLPGASALGGALVPIDSVPRFGCDAAPAVSPPELRIVPTWLVAVKPGAAEVPLRRTDAPLDGPLMGLTEASYLYSDTDGSLTGELGCLGGGYDTRTRYDIHLRRGWNVVLFRLDELVVSEDPAVPTRARGRTWTGPLPEALRWRWQVAISS